MSVNKFDFGSVPEFGVASSVETGEAGLKPEQLVNPEISLDYQRPHQGILGPHKKNGAVVKQSETILNIFAVNPSWIRIKDEGRKVVVEKNLKAGRFLKLKITGLTET